MIHSGPITVIGGGKVRTYRVCLRPRQFYRAPYEAPAPTMACRTDLYCERCRITFAGQTGQGVNPFAGPCFCVGEYGGCRETLRRAP